MKSYRSWLKGWVLMFAICGGCAVESGDGDAVVEVVPGTLVVDWTINGSADPGQCDLAQVEDIVIHVTTSDGVFVGDFAQDCTAMAASIELDPGDYAATASLVDATGAEITTEVFIDPFVLDSGEELQVPIDFPANSFR